MGSGLIYAALVVMWAAYFIPRWLRRHEELSESRSVERFDRAMRILSRRDATPDKRYVVMPARPAQPVVQPQGRRASSGAAAELPAQRTRPARRGLRTTSPVTVRRRRVLAGLLLTLLVALALTPLSGLRWWAPVLVLVTVVGYLVHCRLQARTRSAVSRTRQSVRKRSRSRLMRFDAIERLMTVRRELAEERAADEIRWQESEQRMEDVRRETEAEHRRTEHRRQEAAAGWSPVAVPLPTYVTKPPAPRRASTIDLTNPGAWTEAQLARRDDDAPAPAAANPAEPAAMHPAAPAVMSGLLDDAEAAEDQLDAIIERRAVND